MPSSSNFIALRKAIATGNIQVSLDQNGRKPNNTFGALQRRNNRVNRISKTIEQARTQQIYNLFNSLNNSGSGGTNQTFFNNLNNNLIGNSSPVVYPINNSSLSDHYGLKTTINFLGTVTDSLGNQTFPLESLPSSSSTSTYIAFSNSYTTYLTSSSTNYLIQIDGLGNKLVIKSKSSIDNSGTYVDISGSPFSKGDSFTLGSNTYFYAGAGCPGIIYSTIPFPNCTINVNDFLGRDNAVDTVNNPSGDLTSGSFSSGINPFLCRPLGLSQSTIFNSLILHDKKRICMVDLLNSNLKTLYEFPDLTTVNYGNINNSCIQKDDLT
jgi:hypothetical protein